MDYANSVPKHGTWIFDALMADSRAAVTRIRGSGVQKLDNYTN
jgi:hypothetical protein